MNRSLNVASIQLDVAPAPTAERLARAGALVAEAAAGGAQLVVLPELFNTGYTYAPDNFARAEPLDGPSVQWLRATAARHGVHLAGSLLARDGGEIFNSLLLVAPDGHTWRYDKHYPWGYERAYFRPSASRTVTVAETALGAIGLLICWDVAHPELWAGYAGRVDLMVVASCPPNVGDPTYVLPDGSRFSAADAPLAGALRAQGTALFGTMLDEQARWLGAPLVASAAGGTFDSEVPRARATLLVAAPLAPQLLGWLPRARALRMVCAMVPATRILDAQGRALAALTPEQGEGLVRATLDLPTERPWPRGPQPPAPVHPLAYAGSDVLLPVLTAPLYERGRAALFGARPDAAARRRARTARLMLGLGALSLGILLVYQSARRRR